MYCLATSHTLMGLSVQAHQEWEGLSPLLTDGEGRLWEGKITHCKSILAGREGPGVLTQQHGLEFLNAFQVKDCLFKAQQFCCLSSAAKGVKKLPVISLYTCTASMCLCLAGCVCERVCLCVYAFGQADEDYSGALGCFLCSRL